MDESDEDDQKNPHPSEVTYISNPYANQRAKRENESDRKNKRQARDKRINEAVSSYPEQYIIYRDLCKQFAGACGRKLNAFWHDAILIEDDQPEGENNNYIDEEPVEKKPKFEEKKQEEKKNEKLTEFEKNLEIALSLGRQNDLEIHGLRSSLTSLRNIVGKEVKNAAAHGVKRQRADPAPPPQAPPGHDDSGNYRGDRPMQPMSNFHPSLMQQPMAPDGRLLFKDQYGQLVTIDQLNVPPGQPLPAPVRTMGFYHYNNNDVSLTAVQRDHTAFLNGMNEIKGDRLEPIVYEVVQDCLALLRESKNNKTRNLRTKVIFGNPDYRAKFVQLMRAVSTQGKHVTSTTWIRPQAMRGNNMKLQELVAWFDNLE